MSQPNNMCTFVGRYGGINNYKTLNGQNGPYATGSVTITVEKQLSKKEKDENQAAKNANQPLPNPKNMKIFANAMGSAVDNMIQYCKEGDYICINCHYDNYKKSDGTYGNSFKLDDWKKLCDMPYPENNQQGMQGYQNQAPQNQYQQQQYQQSQPPQNQYQQQPNYQNQAPAQNQYQQPNDYSFNNNQGMINPAMNFQAINDDDIPF